MIGKSRTALDEIRVDDDDDFAPDLEEEIRQSLLHACDELLQEAPPVKLLPRPVIVAVSGDEDYDPIRTEYTDGHGSLLVPDDFLLLGELRLRSWQGSVRTLLEPGSDAAMMQRCRWTCGTPQKPKAMLESDGSGRRVISYWTAGRYAMPPTKGLKSVYDHRIERFTYIPMGCISTDSDGTEWLDVALTDDCGKSIIYRALSMVMVTKKETELAEALRGMSNVEH